MTGGGRTGNNSSPAKGEKDTKKEKLYPKHDLFSSSFTSISPTRKGKSETYGFELFSYKQIDTFINAMNASASIAVEVERGHRAYHRVTAIYNWLRIDIDESMDEYTKVLNILKPYFYIDLPSTRFDPDNKEKNFKRHILVRTENISQCIGGYKVQMTEIVKRLNLDFISDNKTIINCVQNMNPYKNGDAPEEALRLSSVHEGKVLKLIKVKDSDFPKNRTYKTSQIKGVKGKDLKDIPAPIVEKRTDKVTVMNPDSVVNTVDGFVTLGKISKQLLKSQRKNATMSQLGCVNHNQEHEYGPHHCGYGHASASGGVVYFHCGGTHCKDSKPVVIGDGLDGEVILESRTKKKKKYKLPFLIDEVLFDKKKVYLTLFNMGYDPNKGKFLLLEQDGIARVFTAPKSINHIRVMTDGALALTEKVCTHIDMKYNSGGKDDRIHGEILQNIAKDLAFKICN